MTFLELSPEAQDAIVRVIMGEPVALPLPESQRAEIKAWAETDELPKFNFKKGDTVRHHPTGETWILIRDEEDGYVYPGGWPTTRAKASDCTILR